MVAKRDEQELAKYFHFSGNGAENTMSAARGRVLAQFETHGMADDYALSALVEAQGVYRFYALAKAALDNSAPIVEAIALAVRDANRVLRDTSSTTGAVKRAQMEADRHGAVRFLDQWENEI